jgi:hypothetical protein
MTDVAVTTVAALAARLEALEARTRSLEAENSALRARAATSLPSSPLTSDGTPSGPERSVGRRHLLTKGLAAAGAAAAGAVLLDGGPAAAADGNAIFAGRLNNANRITVLDATGEAQNQGESAFEVRDNGASLFAERAGIGVVARNGRFSTGVVIDSSYVGMDISSLHGININCTGRGLDINSDSDGIQVVADEGAITGVTQGADVAVAGIANDVAGGTGVYAVGTTGVDAASVYAGGSAVKARATNGLGVDSIATVGSGIRARGSYYGVIAQSTTTDPTQAALFASALAGMAIGCNTDTGQVFSGVSGTGGGMQVAAPLFHLRLDNQDTRGDPTNDTFRHERGDIVEASSGDLWLCTNAGRPGTWRKLAGPATAGAFHVLPAAVRVYDSRPGIAPTNVGPKTPFAPNETRSFDLRANSSGVPAGATAAMVNLHLINAANAPGFVVIWANGKPRPTAISLGWGGSAGRFSTLAVAGLDTGARVQVYSSARTDLGIDVVGYYR